MPSKKIPNIQTPELAVLVELARHFLFKTLASLEVSVQWRPAAVVFASEQWLLGNSVVFGVTETIKKERKERKETKKNAF